MIGSYNGPIPEECSAEIQAAEDLRNNTTNINKYLSDFFELWNTLPEVPKVKNWEWTEITPKLNNRALNSHSCPEGGVTNFTFDESRPQSYPAITGRLEVIFWETLQSECFGLPTKESKGRIPVAYFYSGSGNGAWSDDNKYYGYSTHVTFWLQDFPKIWEAYQEIEDKGALQELELNELSLALGPVENLAGQINHGSLVVREAVKQRLGEILRGAPSSRA